MTTGMKISTQDDLRFKVFGYASEEQAKLQHKIIEVCNASNLSVAAVLTTLEATKVAILQCTTCNA